DEVGLAPGNMIRDNAQGIMVSGAGAQGNTIQGNLISENTNEGVRITSGASNNLVGGFTEASRNVISANSGGGVSIDSAAHDNRVAANYIGTDEKGNFDPNDATGNDGFAGVALDDAKDNIIGSLTNEFANYIEGNNLGVAI